MLNSYVVAHSMLMVIFEDEFRHFQTSPTTELTLKVSQILILPTTGYPKQAKPKQNFSK